MREENHNDVSRAIIKTLLYSDIFSYPLTSNEIFDRLEIPCDRIDIVEHELQQLVASNVVFKVDCFYSLRDDFALAIRRMEGNKRAKDMMPRAIRRSRLIYSFPFVRAVMISGSLSKDFMDKDSDIDFFIVTEPGKVWLTRGLLALFQRIVLFNSHKYFCVNYYIDYDHLGLDERNIFTATELITLKPVCGNEHYEALVNDNGWVKKYYPGFRPSTPASEKKLSLWPKKFLELLLRPFSAGLDVFVMEQLSKRAVRIHGQRYEKKDFDVAFKAGPHVSKNHAGNYQRKITDKFNQRVATFFSEMVPQ
jgi:hypothetical protein